MEPREITTFLGVACRAISVRVPIYCYLGRGPFPAFYVWMCVSPKALKSDAEKNSFAKLDYYLSILNWFFHLFVYLRNIYWVLLRDQIPGSSDLSDSVVAFKSSHNRGSENNKEQTCVKCKLEKNRNNLFLCKHYLAKIYFKQKRTVCQIGKEWKSSLSRKKHRWISVITKCGRLRQWDRTWMSAVWHLNARWLEVRRAWRLALWVKLRFDATFFTGCWIWATI